MFRTIRTAAALVAVLLTATGCGFLDAMAHPEAQAQAAEATTSPAAPTTPGPDDSVVIANVPLQTDDGATYGQLVVTTGSIHTGLVLPFEEFSEDCPVDGPSMQYVPVTFTLAGGDPADGGLAAHLTVTPGPSTPADIGDVGVFFNPTQGHDEYCQDYPPLPTTDSFWVRGGPDKVSGYVVLDKAVTSTTPEGRADVFPTLQARIDHIRILTGGPDTLTLSVGAGPVGTACADDPAALCVPLR